MLHALIVLQVLVTDRVERVRGDRGATAVEYGLMVGLIAAVIVVAVGLLGTEVNSKFDAVCDAIKGGAGC